MVFTSGLSRVWKSPALRKIELNNSSKIILFSDLHRGVGDWSDDFAYNKPIFMHAFQYYFENGYTYIEIGDGDELWENKKFRDIKIEYYNIFQLMSEFSKQDRLILIWGNHNRYWKNPENVQKKLEELVGIKKFYEGIKLGDSILVIHGHQVDFICDHWLASRISEILVNNIWKFLQNVFGFKDPTSPAKNFRIRNKIEKKILHWARNHHVLVIAGHTHRPVFCSLSKEGRIEQKEEMPYYFNVGSCVHPRCITGIEIDGNCIRLIKWFKNVDEQARLFIDRQVLETRKLHDILSQLVLVKTD